MKKFKIKSLNSLQNYCLNEILKKKSRNVLLSIPYNSGCTLIYHILSEILDGIIIVITNNQFTLKKKLINYNENASWAFLSPNLEKEQKDKIFEYIEEKKVKLLYISPEIFDSDYLVSFHNIGLLVIGKFYLF